MSQNFLTFIRACLFVFHVLMLSSSLFYARLLSYLHVVSSQPVASPCLWLPPAELSPSITCIFRLRHGSIPSPLSCVSHVPCCHFALSFCCGESSRLWVGWLQVPSPQGLGPGVLAPQSRAPSSSIGLPGLPRPCRCRGVCPPKGRLIGHISCLPT